MTTEPVALPAGEAVDGEVARPELHPPWYVRGLVRIRTFEALRFRDYRLLWLGQAGNTTGQWMDQVTRGWLMYELTGSPLQLGLVSAVRAIPLLLFSVLAGVVADRYGRKRQLIISQVTNAILNFVLAALVITRLVEPWHVYATALLAGVVMAFQQPARQAMVPDLVDRGHLANAIGLQSLAFNACRSVAPGVAGALIAAVDVGGSYVVQGLIFSLGTIWTAQIHEPRSSARPMEATGAERSSLLAGIVDGARYIWSNRPVRSVMMIVLIPAVLGQPFTSLLPIFARDILDVGAGGQGLLLTSLGLGALAGAVVIATAGNMERQGAFVLAGAAVFGVGMIGFGASAWFALSLIMMSVVGLCDTAYGTQANTIVQIHTDPSVRGRVMGVYFLNRGLVPLGSLFAGALASAIGAPLTVEVMGASCAALALGVAALAPEVRHLRSVASRASR
ncbi:MAG TPA: MFS transporter [Chloroflexota bacterium]|nr:MFS transporter [Chloroflexota bacterium]